MPAQLAKLDLRVEQRTKKALEQAASLCGQSLKDFAKTTLTHRAAEVLRQHQVTLLTDEEWERFMQIVDADEEPNEALKKAAAEYKAQHG
ncbi:MAG: DUF1778 domain-containing protein [Planctomycetota bacterium]